MKTQFDIFVDPYAMRDEINEIRHPFFRFKCDIKDGWVIVSCICKSNPKIYAMEYEKISNLTGSDDFYQLALNVLGRITIMLVGYEDLDSYRPNGDEVSYAYQNMEEDDRFVFWWEPFKE